MWSNSLVIQRSCDMLPPSSPPLVFCSISLTLIDNNHRSICDHLYTNRFQILASIWPRFLAIDYHAFQRGTQSYATIRYLCASPALRKRSEASPSAACRLFFLSLSSLCPAFPTFRPSLSTRSEQRGPRSITAENPGGASFLSPVLTPLSLSLSYTLHLLSYPLVHIQTCAERVHMLGHTQRRAAFLLSSIRSAASAVHRFLLDFTRLHRNRIFTATEATLRTTILATTERRERRQCEAIAVRRLRIKSEKKDTLLSKKARTPEVKSRYCCKTLLDLINKS